MLKTQAQHFAVGFELEEAAGGSAVWLKGAIPLPDAGRAVPAPALPRTLLPQGRPSLAGAGAAVGTGRWPRGTPSLRAMSPGPGGPSPRAAPEGLSLQKCC